MMNRKLWQNPVCHAGAVFLGFCGLYGLVFGPRLWHWPLTPVGDVFAYYIPVFYAPRSLWTPLLQSGFPGFADPQFQLWYPINRLFSWFPQSWEYFIVSAYVLASCFTYGYVYRMTHSRLAAAMSGLVYGMSGFMVAYVGYSSMLHAAAWLPLLIWALAELRQPGSSRWCVIGGIAIAGMVLAGHPQITVYGCGLGVAYSLAMGWRSPTGTGRYYRDCGLLLLLGLGLAAIQILPTFEFVQLTLRSQMSFENFVSSAATWTQLVQLIFPYYIAPGASGLGLMGYVGVMAFSLAAIGFWTGGDRRMARFWLIVVGLNLLLGLGAETPLASVLYHVPLYNKFRAPIRHWFVLSFALSVLMGMGMVALQRQRVTWRLWRSVLAATVAIAAIGLSVIGFLGFPSQHGISTIGLPIGLLVIGLTAVSFIVRSPVQSRSRFWHLLLLGLLLGLVCLDGAAFNWLAYSKTAQQFPAYPQPSATALTYKANLLAAHQRLLPVHGGQGTTLDDIPPDTSLQWRVPSASGYGPLILSRYSELLGMDEFGGVMPTVLGPTDRALDLLSVRYVLSPPIAAADRWRKQETISANTLIYENANVMPRAWLVAETIALDAAQILTTIRTSRLPDGRVFQPAQMALVEDPQMALKAPVDGQAIAKILDVADTQVKIQTQSIAPAFLVLSDVFYPGWQATIDGQPTPIYQTNYIQRGVQVPAGEHVVEFKFAPLSWQLGAGITLLSGGASAYCWWQGRRSNLLL